MKTQFDDPEILKAIEELEKVSREKKTRDEYSRREKALWDYVSLAKIKYIEGHQVGVSVGFEKGLSEGREEECEKIAVNLLKTNAEHTYIKQITGLSDEKLDELRKLVL